MEQYRQKERDSDLRNECGWTALFECFEGRCSPRTHAYTSKRGDLDWEDMLAERIKCKNCYKTDSQQRCDECLEEYEEALNEEVGREFPAWRQRHEYNKHTWRVITENLMNGNDQGYDDDLADGTVTSTSAAKHGSVLKVLRKCFGLEVHLSTEHQPDHQLGDWTEHENNHWHDYWRDEQNGLRTTVCYLTSLLQGTSDPIDIPEGVFRRFGAATGALGLAAYVHPSQFRCILAAVPKEHQNDEASSPGAHQSRDGMLN